MSKEGPQFIGRAYTEEEAQKSQEAVERWKRGAAEPMVGEREKTEFDLKVIDMAKKLLAEQLSAGGFNFSEIETGQIHIFDDESYRARFGESGAGTTNGVSGAIGINRDVADTTMRYLAVVLHEMIHAASAKKFYLSEARNIYDARVGFRLRSVWKKDRMKDTFIGLNEFITEIIVYMILQRNAEKLVEELSISLEEINGSSYNYMHYGATVNAVVTGIGAYKGVSPAKILGKFSRGPFENTLLVLKDVEKPFGKGALKILASLGSFRDEEKDVQNQELVEEFFTTEDSDRREDLRKKILQSIKDASGAGRLSDQKE